MDRKLKHQRKQLDTFQKENEELREELKDNIEWSQTVVDRFNVYKEENTKLKESLKDIRSQLFDSKNCETILTKSIDALLKD
jgi:cell shape-determining protein MreC